MQRKKTGGQVYFRARNFTRQFNDLMVEHSVSQSSIATRLGVSQGAVSNWKFGSVPQLRTAKALAAIFGVNVNWLLYGDEPKTAAGQAEPVIQDVPIPQNFTPPLNERGIWPKPEGLDTAQLRELAVKLDEASGALGACAKVLRKAAGRPVRVAQRAGGKKVRSPRSGGAR